MNNLKYFILNQIKGFKPFLLAGVILGWSICLTFSLPCRASQAEELISVYMYQNLSGYNTQLKNAPLMDLTLRSKEQVNISLSVETNDPSRQTVFINYYSGEGRITRSSEKTINIPLGNINSEWSVEPISRNVANDITILNQTFSSIKSISFRGKEFDIRKISFSNLSRNPVIDLTFAQANLSISDFGWLSNNGSEYFTLVYNSNDPESSYLQVKGIKSESTPTPNQPNNQETSSQTKNRQASAYYPYSSYYGYSPFGFDPFLCSSFLFSPFSQIGLYGGMGGIGYPFPYGIGYGNELPSDIRIYNPYLKSGITSSLLSSNSLTSWYQAIFSALLNGAVPNQTVPSYVRPTTIAPRIIPNTTPVITTVTPTTTVVPPGKMTGYGGPGKGTVTGVIP